MDAEDKLKKRLKLIGRLKKMKPRFAKLFRKNGTTVTDFSRTHGFNDSHLSHQMAGRRGATEEYVDRLDECLKAEGV